MRKRINLLVITGILFGFSISPLFAACPTTNCEDDCASGSRCYITQYENGEVCSWTICYGKGAKFDFEG